MNYQNILCVGDSQSFGARSYGCYPLYLGEILNEKTPYHWRIINRSTNGHTARDLWFRLNYEIDQIHDTFQACVLIGTNDVAEQKDINIFEEYYRQIVATLLIKQYRAIYCGEIPPIHADGHVFFKKSLTNHREDFNSRIQNVVSIHPNAHFVPMEGLERDCYEDPVHFNEKGNMQVATCFAETILTV